MLRTRRGPGPPRQRRGHTETKSVSDQLRELRAWAHREHWEIVGEFSDDGISASRYAQSKLRPRWSSVVEVLAAGRADILAVWEMSRASRDRAVFATLLTQCADSGVMIATGSRLHDPADADEGFLLDLTGALAVRESHVTSKRVRRAARSRAIEGQPHSSLGFGYRRVCDRPTGRTERWEPDPETAPIVKEIVERLLRNETTMGVAKDLNRCGLPAPNKNRRSERNTIKKLARRAAYAGLRTYRGRILEEVTTSWPALITPEQHYAIVAQYNSPDSDRWRNPVTLKYLGTGIYKCGRCSEDRMRVVVQTGRPKRYDCRACHGVSRLQESVDKLVEAVVIDRLSQPDILSILTEDNDVQSAQLRDEAARLRAKRVELRDAWDNDKISTDAYSDLDAHTRSKLEAIEEKLRPKQLHPVVAEIAGKWAARNWAYASMVVRRTILDTLIEVTILPEERRF